MPERVWLVAKIPTYQLYNDLDDLNVTPRVYCTLEEYNALPDSKYTDGIDYYIKDANIMGMATDLGYDNSSSKLEATNVQDAIDEINESLTLTGVELIMHTITSATQQRYYISNYKKLLVRMEFPNGGYVDHIADVKDVIVASNYAGGLRITLTNSLPESGIYYAKVAFVFGETFCQMSDLYKGAGIGDVRYAVYGIK